MLKSQLLFALFLALSLMFASVDAIPCKFCDPLACRRSCKSDLDYCKSSYPNEPCLSYYYICLGTCSVAPSSVDEPAETADELAAPADSAAAKNPASASALNETLAV